MLFGETVAVYCENIWNTQIYCVGRMESFSMLKQVVNVEPLGSKWFILLPYYFVISIYSGQTEET
jgi:hypothetical protein